MKLLISLSIILFNFNAYSWEAFEHWSEGLQQELIVNCDLNELMCLKLCRNNIRCQIRTSFCKDCLGSGLLLTYFYQNVGTWFLNTGKLIHDNELIRFLQHENYILLAFNSPYNIFSPLNDMRMEQAFNSLCPNDLDPFPLVLGRLNHSFELSSIEAVICHGEEGAKTFFISDLPSTQVNQAYLEQALSPP